MKAYKHSGTHEHCSDPRVVIYGQKVLYSLFIIIYYTPQGSSVCIMSNVMFIRNVFFQDFIYIMPINLSNRYPIQHGMTNVLAFRCAIYELQIKSVGYFLYLVVVCHVLSNMHTGMASRCLFSVINILNHVSSQSSPLHNAQWGCSSNQENYILAIFSPLQPHTVKGFSTPIFTS